MMKPLAALLIEDSTRDELLIVRELRKTGFELSWERVDTAAGMHRALEERAWDVVLADYVVPGFGAVPALELLRQRRPAPPVIVVSGAIDEEIAVETMRAGATDFVLKDKLWRLGDVVLRALREVETLQASEARKAAIFEAALDAIITIDHEGRIVEQNRAAEQMFGYSSQEALGREMAALIIPERLRQAHREGLLRCLATGTGPILDRRVELCASRRDGAEFPVEIAITRIRLPGPPLFTGHVRDIAQRKQADKALREAAETQRFLSEVSAGLAALFAYPWVVDEVARLAVPFLAAFCVVEVVEAEVVTHVAVWHEDTGKLPLAREVVRRSLPRADVPHGVLHVIRSGAPDAIAAAGEEDMAAALGIERVEALRELGAGAYLCVPLGARGAAFGAMTLLRAAPYTAPDVAVAEDMAKRVALAIDNARLYRDATDAIQARDEFLHAAAHELRTPLTPMRLDARAIRERAPVELEAPLRRVERSVSRMEALVDRMLDASAIHERGLRLERTQADLGAIAREAADALAQEMARAGCAWTLGAEAPVRGLWDRLRLEQVVMNLLTNAMKFGRGKPIEIAVEGGAGVARLSVRDHGIGIPPSKRAKIFERFGRGESLRHYGGFGLGLWISRQIVEAHGGRIDVSSAPEEGSIFTVELPRDGALAPADETSVA